MSTAGSPYIATRLRWSLLTGFIEEETEGNKGMSNDDLMILKVLSRLNEAQARLYVAKEAICNGRGGVQRMHRLTGLSRPTIVRGMLELRQQEPANPAEGVQQLAGGCEGSKESVPTKTTQRAYRQQQHRIRRPDGGRKLIEERDPGIVPVLERLLADEIAGDPMTEQKWVRSSLCMLSKKLADEGHQASTATVARLLKDMDFSLKANKRKQGRLGCPERDQQFKYIASQKQRFITAGWPIISIDTKKQELIGEFRNNGRTWRRQAEEVNEQFARSLSGGRMKGAAFTQ
jgi:hypothetical protein